MVHCCTGRPNVWWRNLVKAESVDLVLRGQSLTGVPRVLAEATDESQKLLRNLLIASPRDAAFAGVALKADGRPCESDLADAAARLVFITIKLPAEVGDGEGGGS